MRSKAKRGILSSKKKHGNNEHLKKSELLQAVTMSLNIPTLIYSFFSLKILV